jgi:hypothetical protein
VPNAQALAIDTLNPRYHRGLLKVTTASGSEYLIACGASQLAHVTSAKHKLRWRPLTFNFTVRRGQPMIMHRPGEQSGYLGPTAEVKSIEPIGIGEIKPKTEMIYHISTNEGKFELMIIDHPQDVGIIEALDDQAFQTLANKQLPTESSFSCNFGIGDSCDGRLMVGREASFGLHKTGGRHFTALITGIEPQE